MAMQIHMKIDGVKGDSKGFQYKGWCDVQSMNWGMTSDRGATTDTPGRQTSLNELSIVKLVGIDSASIRSLFAQGAIIPCVDLSVVPALSKREVQTKYLDIRMEEVLIRSVSVSGDAEDNYFREHVSLLFERIKFEYSLNPMRGADEDAPVAIDFSWNVSSNDVWER